MEPQVEQMIPHLKPGSSYLFDHIRKGPFVAEYLGTKPTPGDAQDSVFLDVNIVTEEGSGQERLANTFMRDEFGRKMRPPFEGRLIRPSLLRSITTPSTQVQRELTQKFLAIREAKKVDQETLSMPTEIAFAHVGAPEGDMEKKPGFFKRLFGGKN